MSNTSPEVGKTYTIDHAWNGRYTVVVTGIRNDWLTIQITDRRARALVPMNERSEGDHLTAHAADGHAIAEARRIAAKAEATLYDHYGVPYCGDSECPSGDYPRYGVAPHEHDESGATKLLPRDQWPASFTEDPGSPGHGVYWCPRCGDAQKAAMLARVMTEPEGDVE